MQYEIYPLRLPALSQLEAAQLIRTHQSNIDALEAGLITDDALKAYFASVFAKLIPYEKAILQIQANEETKKIELADGSRDKALSVVVSAVNLHLKSDDPVEVEAAKSLNLLLAMYKNLGTASYEAESMGLDKLVGELESDGYKTKVETLMMGRYVVRLKEANIAFKSLFDNRLVVSSLTETYNAKELRRELFAEYAETTRYIGAMANAHKTPQYVQVLQVINGARKYYAEMLARREGGKEEVPAK